jgi:PAS domain S-box-containing protein
LVADDNANTRAYLKRLLGRRYNVETVPDGQAALEAVRSCAPDLMLIGVIMPGLDGFGLLKALRADESARSIPVIMLSARAGEEAMLEGLYAGADDYLIKPFSARELLARVNSQLGMARLRHESEERVREVNAELSRRLAELEKANLEIRDSRRAALNVMEDAIRAKEALRESEGRFRMLADNAPALIWVTSPTECEFVNREYLEFLGVSEEEVLGDNWAKFVHPEDREDYVNAFREAVSSRSRFEGEFRFRRRDGEYRWMQSVGMPRFEGSEFKGYVGSSHDIHERKLAEIAMAHMAAIVESSDASIISKDLNGAITSWNKGAERLFGYTAEEVIGKPVAILIPPNRADEEPRILECLRRGERIDHYETVRRRKNGQEIDISLTISPIRDKTGKAIGASTIARDISERKRIEAERGELLLKESAARAEAEAARAEAEAANRSKDEFLAVVSHELRSPLNSILGYNRMLRERHSDESQLKHSCDIIERNARTQLQLIEDLLDTARIGSGKLRLDLRKLDIIPALVDALDIVRPAAEAKGVRLRIADCGLEKWSRESGVGSRGITSLTSFPIPHSPLPFSNPQSCWVMRPACSRSSGTCSRMRSSSLRPAGVWNCASNAPKSISASSSVTRVKAFNRNSCLTSSTASNSAIRQARSERAAWVWASRW